MIASGPLAAADHGAQQAGPAGADPLDGQFRPGTLDNPAKMARAQGPGLGPDIGLGDAAPGQAAQQTEQTAHRDGRVERGSRGPPASEGRATGEGPVERGSVRVKGRGVWVGRDMTSFQAGG